MDMWHWLMACYKEGSLTLEDLEEVMKNDRAARTLWEDWSRESSDFISYVRDEVWPVIHHLRKKENKENNEEQKNTI
jgi:hypothetical protein